MSAVALTATINGKLIDILTSFKQKDLIKYFNKEPKKISEQIKYFSINIYSPDKAVAENIFPNDQMLFDKFHLVTAINKALDELKVKAETAWYQYDNRKNLYKSRHTLLMAGEDHDDGHQ